MSESRKKTKDLLEGQLRSLREDFRRLPEEELFRMYLHYMVENRIDHFNKIIDSAIPGEYKQRKRD